MNQELLPQLCDPQPNPAPAPDLAVPVEEKKEPRREGIKIRLNLEEFGAAISSSWLRMSYSMRVGMNAATTYDRNWNRRYYEDMIGSCGEIAVGKWTNTFFVPTLETYHKGPDILGNTEVRATDRDDGSLIVRTNDKDDRLFILAIVNLPLVELVGWLPAPLCKLPEYWKNPRNYRFSWFVPQKKLYPMEQFTPLYDPH